MCIPISKFPLDKILKDKASSKSFASLGSIVKVNSFRRSLLFFISDFDISVLMLFAKFSIASSNLYGKP